MCDFGARVAQARYHLNYGKSVFVGRNAVGVVDQLLERL